VRVRIYFSEHCKQAGGSSKIRTQKSVLRYKSIPRVLELTDRLDISLRLIAEFNLLKLAFVPNRHISKITDERAGVAALGWTDRRPLVRITRVARFVPWNQLAI
jgi:hypothetical protein